MAIKYGMDKSHKNNWLSIIMQLITLFNDPKQIWMMEVTAKTQDRESVKIRTKVQYNPILKYRVKTRIRNKTESSTPPFFLVDSLEESWGSDTISSSEESFPCWEAQNLLGWGIGSVQPFLTLSVFCWTNLMVPEVWTGAGWTVGLKPKSC